MSHWFCFVDCYINTYINKLQRRSNYSYCYKKPNAEAVMDISEWQDIYTIDNYDHRKCQPCQHGQQMTMMLILIFLQHYHSFVLCMCVCGHIRVCVHTCVCTRACSYTYKYVQVHLWMHNIQYFSYIIIQIFHWIFMQFVNRHIILFSSVHSPTLQLEPL